MEDLAKQLNLSVWTLGLITSNLFVVDCTVNMKFDENTKMDKLQHWNIGLCMKSKNGFEKIILPGYTRYVGYPNNEDSSAKFWEFSSAAVDIIKEYLTNYKFVFDSLERYREMYATSNKFFKVKSY
jgi:hypothetical protein